LSENALPRFYSNHLGTEISEQISLIQWQPNNEDESEIVITLSKFDWLVIDLGGLLGGKKHTDVVLENGDTLIIRGKNQSINVIGEVYVPTSHLFSKNLSYEDYTSRSGGIKSLADEDKIYIIRANGPVELPANGKDFWFA
jgi:hypothetical protein